MVNNKVVETDELNKQAEEVQDPEEEAKVTQKYENITKTKKKELINMAFHQGKVLKGLRTRRSLSH